MSEMSYGRHTQGQREASVVDVVCGDFCGYVPSEIAPKCGSGGGGRHDYMRIEVERGIKFRHGRPSGLVVKGQATHSWPIPELSDQTSAHPLETAG